VEGRERLVVHTEAWGPAEAAPGGTVLATTVRPEGGADTAILQTSQAQHTPVAPGLRWSKHPAASSPVWLEQPERIAALARLTVVGVLGYAVIQRHVRLSLRDHHQQLPGHKGLTAIPTAAVVFALLAPGRLGQCEIDQSPSLHVQGLPADHLIVCTAVGIDQAWYQAPTMGQNSPMRTTPP
jgi:hypothetical protein